MNVWVLNHYAKPPDAAGGTRHFDIARELVKAEHHVMIVASSFSHRTRRSERGTGSFRSRSETVAGDGFYWIEEYPSWPPANTLNGFIFGTFGLYE